MGADCLGFKGFGRRVEVKRLWWKGLGALGHQRFGGLGFRALEILGFRV